MLVRGGRLGSHRTVSAAATIGPAAWPQDLHALVERLRDARRRLDLPARARVVAWDGAASAAPLVEAGFEITATLTPAQALARVARGRLVGAPAGTAIAALSLNTHGGVIAIVSGSDVVHSRGFEWTLGTPFTGARSELLDRYLLVSQIAPQLEHVIDLVRPVYGVTVTSVVACGNLPNLRSLSMLLIEEMDLEVETLDSDELLDASMAPSASIDSIASLQLAAAVASPGEAHAPMGIEPEPGRHASATEEREATAPPRQGARFQGLAAVAATALIAVWSALQISGTSPATGIFPGGLPVDERVATMAPASTGVPAAAATSAPSPAAVPGVEATSGAANAADATPVSSAAPRRTDGRRLRPARAPDSDLPSVDGILIAGNRRLAIVGGEVVAAGDIVGVRAVSRIERDGVVLREPSGREIYVAIRPRRPPTLGS